MKTSQTTKDILPALAKVKKELSAVAKSANNPFFKSKYADLNTYLEEVEKHLDSNGLVLLQGSTVDPTLGVTVSTTTIFHAKSGEFVESSMIVDVPKGDMQKAGAGLTYARRYTLAGLLAMQTEDDDGNMATGKTTKTVTAARSETKSETPATEVKSVPKGRASFAKKTTTTSASKGNDF